MGQFGLLSATMYMYVMFLQAQLRGQFTSKIFPFVPFLSLGTCHHFELLEGGTKYAHEHLLLLSC